MLSKKYKDANNDIEVEHSLKEDTIKKMKDSQGKKNGITLYPRIALAALAIVIIGSSLFIKNRKIETYAIGTPVYPTKIGFEDFDAKFNRREDIDEKFIKNLNDFSIKSSSLVLSDTDRDTNSLYSPISLYMALAMVGETVKGETQDQIVNALSMDSMELIRSETGKLFRRLYFHNEIGRLTLANSLWLNKNVRFNENKLDTLAKDYYAHSFSLDFSKADSPKKISDWVSENTGGKLGNDPNDFQLALDDVMSLINTVSFYDEWIDSFSVKSTKKDIFYLDDGNKVETDFMNMTFGSHSFVGGDGYTVSQLVLKNRNSMVFILPDEDKSPYDIVSDPKVLQGAITALSTDESQTGQVVFKIPKFKFSSKLELNGLARKLGIESIFKESADFSPLSETKPLFISDIKQSAFISIDEKGVEAAAFTEILYCGSAMPEGRADMILDRPFIFVITGVDNSPLFIGIVNNPTL